MDVKTFELELKNNNLKSLYLLYGEETYLIDSALKKIKKNFGEIINGINYILIDSDNIDALIDNLEVPAFGYEKKLVIVRNSGLFPKERKNKKEDKKTKTNKIAEYIEKNIDTLKETIILIFVEEEINKNDLYSVIEKNGEIVEYKLQRVEELQEKIKNICKLYKVEIDNFTTSYFIENCGQDMQTLINEIRKQIEYVGEGGKITRENIDELGIKKLEAIIFELTDSLGNKNIEKALEVLNNLIYSKEPVQKILITLYNTFKKIYFTKIALKEKKNIAKSIGLKPNQLFLEKKYSMQSRNFEEIDLRNILQELINIDYKSKKGDIDINIGLEAVLCKYCSR